MAFYVDFSTASNPGFLPDDPANPMGWAEFVVAGPNVYYCKGEHDENTLLLYVADKEVRAWDLAVFGPWRVNVDVISGVAGPFSNSWLTNGGIVSANDMIIQGAAAQRNYTFYNTHFILANKLIVESSLSSTVNIDFNGCTVRADDLDVAVGTPESVLDDMNFTDSIVEVNTNANRGNEFKNSVFNKPDSAWSTATHISCQFNWIPPVWPAWDAIKDLWKYSVLGANITANASGNFTNYETGLFGIVRSITAGIGSFYFDVSNYRIYMTQTVNRHVIKRLDSNINPAVYDGQRYGIYGEIGRLRFPSGVTSNGENIFVCDYKNERIVRLDLALNFIEEYSTSSTIDKPYLIYYDSTNDDLYVLGITPNFWNCKLERLTINLDDELESVKVSDYLGKFTDGAMPTALCRGFGANEFLVCGLGNDIFVTTEELETFTEFSNQAIFGEDPTRYTGMIHHSDDNLYMNNGEKLLRVNSTFENTGDSDHLSNTMYGLKEVIDAELMFYDADRLTFVKYDTDLNFIEDVFTDSGDTIDLDAKFVVDFLELDLRA